MLGHLGWVKSLIRHAQYLGIVLFLTYDKLPEVNGTSYARSIVMKDSHPICISVIGYPPHFIYLGGICEKTHTLQPSISKNRRRLISCFPFNGESHILKLKFLVTSSFVDHYIITQGYFSHLGVKKELTFNYNDFPEVAHKIIYMPLRNFPFTRSAAPLSDIQKWKNEFYMRDIASTILTALAQPKDIITLEDVDEILSRAAMNKFRPEMLWASCQVRMYPFYFNQLSSVQDGEKPHAVNYQYNTIKIILMSQLSTAFKGKLSQIRRIGCNTDVYSRLVIQKKQLKCEGFLIQEAGWHFSYVLDKANLEKKIRSAADFSDIERKVQNETQEKSGAVSPGAHNVIITIQDSYLPAQLTNDLRDNGPNSIFFGYVTEGQRSRIVKQYHPDNQKVLQNKSDDSQKQTQKQIEQKFINEEKQQQKVIGTSDMKKEIIQKDTMDQRQNQEDISKKLDQQQKVLVSILSLLVSFAVYYFVTKLFLCYKAKNQRRISRTHPDEIIEVSPMDFGEVAIQTSDRSSSTTIKP